MKRNDFSLRTSISEAWRRLGVPTDNIGQATRWHDDEAGVWTLWIENPNGVNFVSQDKGATLVLTPRPTPDEPDGFTEVHRNKNRRYWGDLRRAAEQGRVIRILAIKWKRDINGSFVEEQHGATVPVYWREMQASLHEDGQRIVLKEPSTGGAK